MLKEINTPGIFRDLTSTRVFGEFSSYKYGTSLSDQDDFELLSSNPYINCCIHQGEKGQTNYFGSLVRHATWVPLLTHEEDATIADSFDPGQLWLEEGKITRADFALGISRCEDEREEKVKLKKFFEEINPEFLKKPYIRVTFGITMSTDRYKYFPAANRLMRVNRRSNSGIAG